MHWLKISDNKCTQYIFILQLFNKSAQDCFCRTKKLGGGEKVLGGGFVGCKNLWQHKIEWKVKVTWRTAIRHKTLNIFNGLESLVAKYRVWNYCEHVPRKTVWLRFWSDYMLDRADGNYSDGYRQFSAVYCMPPIGLTGKGCFTWSNQFLNQFDPVVSCRYVSRDNYEAVKKITNGWRNHTCTLTWLLDSY